MPRGDLASFVSSVRVLSDGIVGCGVESSWVELWLVGVVGGASERWCCEWDERVCGRGEGRSFWLKKRRRRRNVSSETGPVVKRWRNALR